MYLLAKYGPFPPFHPPTTFHKQSYCYGGKFAIDSNNTGLIDVSVVCHPSFVTEDSFKKVKGPIMFNCAETDDMFNDKMREKVKADLQANPKSPPHDFKVFEK